MKILLVNDYATPTAGAEIMLIQLRNKLRERGHQVRVFAGSAPLIPGESFADATCFGTQGKLQVLSSTWNPSARIQLKKEISSFKPDVVHVKMFLWQLSPSILPLMRDVASVYHVVVYKPVCPSGTKLLPDGSQCVHLPGWVCHRTGCLTLQSWFPLMLQQKLFMRGWRNFSAVITTSSAVRDRLEERGISPVRVIHNGCQVREMRPPLGGAPVFAYAGRLSPEKGIDLLLKAFAGLDSREAELWIAGEGPDRSRLEAMVSNLNLSQRVKFFGQLTRPELERLFDAVWVQVIPSLWAEPFGMVAIEAMMRGTAVIATDAGGLREIVRHGQTGLLVPPGDLPALAASMGELLDRERCEAVGMEGRKVALREYTMDSHAERIEALYRSILK